MCFSRPRKRTFCSCLLAIRNQSSFAPLQDPPRSLSPAQSQVFPYQCSKHSMAKDRVGVADPWTHWEAVDGIVNCQDIEGRFADARNFEKDSSTILFWCMLHGAILVVACNGEQAQRLRKENWNGFPFRAHSSQVARSNPFLVVFIHWLIYGLLASTWIARVLVSRREDLHGRQPTFSIE